MEYMHPFNHKKYDCFVGNTSFFNYITYKIEDGHYETYIFDDETNAMLPIDKVLPEVTDTPYALTLSERDTRSLWSRLDMIGNKTLVKQFGDFVAGEDSNINDTPENWIKRFLKKKK